MTAIPDFPVLRVWTLRPIPEYQGKPVYGMHDVLIPAHHARTYQLTDKMIQYINASPPHLSSMKDGDVIVKTRAGNYTKKRVQYPTRLRVRTSSTQDAFIRCIDTTPHVLLDHRISRGKSTNVFIPRYLSKHELHVLFGFPLDHVHTNSRKIYTRLFGMSLVTHVAAHILLHQIDA